MPNNKSQKKNTYIHTYIHTYVRTNTQRLINISMAKAYRTTSSEALCMLTAATPIIIKLEQIVKRYNTKER